MSLKYEPSLCALNTSPPEQVECIDCPQEDVVNNILCLSCFQDLHGLPPLDDHRTRPLRKTSIRRPPRPVDVHRSSPPPVHNLHAAIRESLAALKQPETERGSRSMDRPRLPGGGYPGGEDLDMGRAERKGSAQDGRHMRRASERSGVGSEGRDGDQSPFLPTPLASQVSSSSSRWEDFPGGSIQGQALTVQSALQRAIASYGETHIYCEEVQLKKALQKQIVATGPPTSLSLGALQRQAKMMAAALVELGVEEGGRVCIYAPSSPAWLVTFFAVILAGGVPCALLIG